MRGELLNVHVLEFLGRVEEFLQVARLVEILDVLEVVVLRLEVGPEALQLPLRRHHHRARVYLVVQSVLPEQPVRLAAHFHDVPDFGLHEHAGVRRALRQVVAEVEVVVFPVGGDHFAVDLLAAGLAVDAEPVQAQEAGGLQLLNLLELVIDLGVVEFALVLEDVAQGDLAGGINLDLTQVRVIHVRIEHQLLLLVRDHRALLC